MILRRVGPEQYRRFAIMSPVADTENIQAILLAAGQGSRFGGHKLRHPLPHGVAIGVQAARNLLAAGLHVLAVVRPDDERLSRLLEREGCEVSACPDAALGMGASLAHGVRCTARADGWIVALADMPRIAPRTIARVAEALAHGAGIVAPVYQGRRGHPVGFAARYYAELSRLTGEAGAKRLMQSHPDAVASLDCDDPGILYDIDREADLERPV